MSSAPAAAFTQPPAGAPVFRSPETGNVVKPALIPARDQTLVYAAQLRSSLDYRFSSHLRALAGPSAPIILARASRPALLAWKAYAFLAPGGAPFDPNRTVAAQSGAPFGCRSALQLLAHRSQGQTLDLNGILTTSDLNNVEWVRSSKTRTAEALFVERLWTVTRELLPPSGLYQ